MKETTNYFWKTQKRPFWLFIPDLLDLAWNPNTLLKKHYKL